MTSSHPSDATSTSESLEKYRLGSRISAVLGSSRSVGQPRERTRRAASHLSAVEDSRALFDGRDGRAPSFEATSATDFTPAASAALEALEDVVATRTLPFKPKRVTPSLSNASNAASSFISSPTVTRMSSGAFGSPRLSTAAHTAAEATAKSSSTPAPHSPPRPLFTTCSVDARSTPATAPFHGVGGAQCEGSSLGRLEPGGPPGRAAHIPSVASVHFFEPTMPSLIECCTLDSSSCVVFKFGPQPTSQFNTSMPAPLV